MTDVYLTRTVHGLAAYDDEARDVLRKIKLGTLVRADVVRPRNPSFHRRFFAMLKVVHDSCGHWNDIEELLTELKWHVGHVHRQKVVDYSTGEVLAEIVRPKSIAWSEMGEQEFQEFVEKCRRVICEKMVPGLEDHVLREEVLRAIT